MSEEQKKDGKIEVSTDNRKEMTMATEIKERYKDTGQYKKTLDDIINRHSATPDDLSYWDEESLELKEEATKPCCDSKKSSCGSCKGSCH